MHAKLVIVDNNIDIEWFTMYASARIDSILAI